MEMVPEVCEIDPESDGIFNKRPKVFIVMFNVFRVNEFEVVKLFVGEESVGL